MLERFTDFIRVAVPDAAGVLSTLARVPAAAELLTPGALLSGALRADLEPVLALAEHDWSAALAKVGPMLRAAADLPCVMPSYRFVLGLAGVLEDPLASRLVEFLGGEAVGEATRAAFAAAVYSLQIERTVALLAS